MEYLVKFTVDELAGPDMTDLKTHVLDEFIVRRRKGPAGVKALLQEMEARREDYVNPQPDTGPCVHEADDIQVQVQTVESWLDELRKAGTEKNS